jgi:transcriptional regulator with XRE-family HTH domain
MKKAKTTGATRALWNLATGERPIGDVLSVARRLRGFTQTELATRLAVSNANISRIEHGADLRVSTLVELARELELELILVPREHLPAVRALLDSLDASALPSDSQKPRFA